MGVGRPGWRTKARIQRVLSSAPCGHRLNYLLQRHVSGGFPMGESKLDEVIASAREHLAAWRRCGKSAPDAHFFEFGAGWDLGAPLTLYCLGIDAQTIVDIQPLLRSELVDDLAARLRSRAEQEGFVRVPLERGTRPLGAYLSELGIDYRAPCDARSTGLSDRSMACITSTNTMEHIGPDDLSLILIECRRLLQPSGCASFSIDYEDHYAKFDEAITVYNFLTFTPRQWATFNSDLHFQNRLRHSDHRQLLLDAGFEIAEEEPRLPSDEDLLALRELRLVTPWSDRPLEDVGIRGARFTVRVPGER